MRSRADRPGPRRCLIVILCLGLWLAACVPVPARPAAAVVATAAPIHIKVGTLPFVSNAILKIAETEGFFAEQGVAVELVPFRATNELIPLLVKGDLDAATPALNAAFFNAVAGGARLRVALPLNSLDAQPCTATAFVARKADVDAEVYATPARWKGARIALPPSGPQAVLAYLLDLNLHQAGMTLRDVQVTTVDLAAQAEALSSGQVDIVCTVEPWVTRMLAKSDLALLLPAEPLAPGLTSSTIVYGQRLLDRPEIGVRFATAYLKAVRQYLQGHTAANVKIVAGYTGLEPELASKICWPDSPADGKINTDSIMAYQAWLEGQGLLDRKLAPEQFVDTSFAEAADRTLNGQTK